MKTKKVVKEYNVDKKILGIMIFLEDMVFESGDYIPEEIKKYTLDYYNKLVEYAGMREKKYLDWDINNIDYNVKIEFEESKNIKK